jgi:hypothetical protein
VLPQWCLSQLRVTALMHCPFRRWCHLPPPLHLLRNQYLRHLQASAGVDVVSAAGLREKEQQRQARVQDRGRDQQAGLN